jgi:molecular chaperone GrpE
MSDAAPPVWTPDPAGDAEGPAPLTPAAVEQVLNDFRAWLGELAALPEPAEAVETIDLHTVVGQFTALRHEVNLQTKATRSAVDQLGLAAEALKGRPPADDGLKPVLKAIVDVYDNLALALKQVERQRATIEPVLAELVAGAEIPEPPEVPAAVIAGVPDRPRSFWSRLFGGSAVPPEFAGAVHRQMLIDWREGVLKDAEARRSRVTDTVNQVRSSLDGLIAGYRMSLNRVDRAVGLVGLEPIPAVGERFDPELMEAVEVVADPGRSAGEVIDEVHRGYRWRGVVFRFAQVKVSR